MKRILMVAYVAGLALATGVPPFADPDKDGPLPKTPTAFETENTGGALEEEAKFPDQKKKKKKPQKLNFTAVSEVRDWRDTKGTIIRARLLAFDAGDRSASKEPLTLIMDGKVRLLIEGRKMFSEMPMKRLSPEDQTFVKGLDAARRRKFTEAKKDGTGRSQTE